MSADPFAAPGAGADDELDRKIRIAELSWIGYSRMVLIFLGVCYGILGVTIPVFYGAMPILDPSMGEEAVPFMVAVGVVMGLFIWAFAIPMFLAAWGLKRGHKWAWFVTVIIGGIMAPSACVPFGVVLLYGMLQEPVRKEFLGS